MAMKIISAADINGFIIGNAEDSEKGTGCTVIICEEGAVGGVDVRGGGPATRETDLLRSENTVNTVNAVVLSGGSAFGLEAASGVMRELADRKIGFNVGDDIFVPIVCGASLYDLPVGEKAFPDVSMGMQAVENAYAGSFSKGNHGAGTGATVGKMKGYDRAMKTGLGTFACGDGVVEVGAIAAVNAVGDIYNGAGNIIAGLRSEDGKTIYGTIKTLKTMVHDGIVPEEEPITFVNRADLDEALAAAAKQLKKQESDAVVKLADIPEEQVEEEPVVETVEEEIVPEEPVPVAFEYAPVDKFEEETPEAEEIPEESEPEEFAEESADEVYIPETIDEAVETELQIAEPVAEDQAESVAEPVDEELLVEEPVVEEFAEIAADEVIEESNVETIPDEIDVILEESTPAEYIEEAAEASYIPESAEEPSGEALAVEEHLEEAPEAFVEEPVAEEFVEEIAEPAFVPEFLEDAEEEPQVLTREEMGYDIVFNTTISCLITNAALTKSQANKLASILHDAYARAIKPVHGTLDGDTVFVLATGKQQVNFDAFAALATDVMQYAIIDGAMSAESAYGLPAAKDMR